MFLPTHLALQHISGSCTGKPLVWKYIWLTVYVFLRHNVYVCNLNTFLVTSVAHPKLSFWHWEAPCRFGRIDDLINQDATISVIGSFQKVSQPSYKVFEWRKAKLYCINNLCSPKHELAKIRGKVSKLHSGIPERIDTCSRSRPLTPRDKT